VKGISIDLDHEPLARPREVDEEAVDEDIPAGLRETRL
jgi:hypothetical protein